MARLPQVQGDAGNWGRILNDFLAVEHNPDGTLKPNSVQGAITSGSITKAQLSSSVQASLDNADAAISGTVPDADASTKGKLQLAGDLTGTAASPIISAGAVTEAKLDAAVQTKLNSPVPADGSITSAKIADGTITNIDIHASAAIAQSKIANLTTDLAGKANATHTHAATDITSGTIATARLGSGTASSSTYLRGDNTWATVSAGAAQNVFVSNTAPTGVSGNYMWIQTGLGSGTDMTFWVEDGQ